MPGSRIQPVEDHVPHTDVPEVADVLAAATALLGETRPPDAASAVDALDRAAAVLGHRVRQASWRREPQLVELVGTLVEVHEARVRVVEAAAARRAARFAEIRAALERLREAGSSAGLLAAAPVDVCRCGFDRALLSRVDGSGWCVSSSHVEGHPGEAGRLAALTGGVARPLGHTAREAEAVRRRTALLVTGGVCSEETVMGALGARSYVVAPVVADGAVIGMLHADSTLSGRDADDEDREVLAILAEGLGNAFHRLGLGRRMHDLDDLVRRMADGARTALHASLAIELDPSTAGPARPDPGALAAGPRLAALLTPREHEVLGYLAGGETNRQIAARLVVSEATVKSHVKSILRKLRATNRADAVARYMRLEQLQA